MNYYNEIDPQCAQWLRNLISAGLIPPGDVDERSIEDVVPNELRGYTQHHFFAGIGGWSLALILPDGREACPLSLARALASLSASQVKALGLQISGTCGLRGFTSSASLDLQSCLGSRLRQQFASDGSILFKQTWKERVTPSGRRYWEHTASARRTSGSGFTGWPTPDARSWRDICSKGGGIRSKPSPSPAQRGNDSLYARICDDTTSVPHFPSDGLSRPVAPVRAFGNAITPQTAAAFINAYMSAEQREAVAA